MIIPSSSYSPSLFLSLPGLQLIVCNFKTPFSDSNSLYSYSCCTWTKSFRRAWSTCAVTRSRSQWVAPALLWMGHRRWAQEFFLSPSIKIHHVFLWLMSEDPGPHGRRPNGNPKPLLLRSGAHHRGQAPRQVRGTGRAFYEPLLRRSPSGIHPQP